MAEQSSGASADGLVGIAVSYDMGWQKRGRGRGISERFRQFYFFIKRLTLIVKNSRKSSF